MDVKKLYDEQEAYIIEMRRFFHRHPEVSLKERNTSLKIQEELGKMGIPYEELKPNYGVVATIRGGKEGKTLALRADMDALPVKEETGLPLLPRMREPCMRVAMTPTSPCCWGRPGC